MNRDYQERLVVAFERIVVALEKIAGTGEDHTQFPWSEMSSSIRTRVERTSTPLASYEQLLKFGRREFGKLRNVGDKALGEMDKVMASGGFHDEWQSS